MHLFCIVAILVLIWNLPTSHCFMVGSRQKGTSSKRTFVYFPSPRFLPTNTTFSTNSNHMSTTSLEATRMGTQATESTSAKERFRNLTRAIGYSVIHDEDRDEDTTKVRTEYTWKKRLENPHGTSHLNLDSKDDFASVADINLRQVGTNPNHPSVFDHNTSSAWKGTTPIPMYWQLLLLRFRLTRAILRPFLMCQRWWRGRPHRLHRSCRHSKKTFSESDLGGTKRHYALLVASVVNSWNGLGNDSWSYFCGDPVAYHRAVVQSAYHRTVASLSPSTLSISNVGIRVSPLQTYAMEWLLRRDYHRKQRKQYLSSGVQR